MTPPPLPPPRAPPAPGAEHRARSGCRRSRHSPSHGTREARRTGQLMCNWCRIGSHHPIGTVDGPVAVALSPIPWVSSEVWVTHTNLHQIIAVSSRRHPSNTATLRQPKPAPVVSVGTCSAMPPNVAGITEHGAGSTGCATIPYRRTRRSTPHGFRCATAPSSLTRARSSCTG